MTIKPDHSLNLLGVRCPDFIESVRNYVRKQCTSGQVIHIVADEPSSAKDIQRYCDFLDHELMHSVSNDEQHQFVIRKG